MKGTTDWAYPEMMLLAKIFNIEDIEGFFLRTLQLKHNNAII